MRNYNRTSKITSDSESIVSMSYVCTAFSLGMTFLMWFFVHAAQSIEVMYAPAALCMFGSIILSFVMMKIDIRSKFSSIAICYTLMTLLNGFSVAVITEMYNIANGSPLVLTALLVSVIVFLLCAITGHKSEMNIFAKNMIMRSLSIFLFALIAISLIVAIFLPAYFNIIDLGITYITIPITMFFIFSVTNTIKDISKSADGLALENESSQMRNGRIAMLCSIHTFILAVSLFLKILRVLAASNSRKR